jgi:hypothetical protein
MKTLAVLGVLFVAVAAQADIFDDVQYWVGSGSQEALLVLDWKDGKAPESLVWGYRYDGAKTAEDMLRAVAGTGYLQDPVTQVPVENLSGADPRVFAVLDQYGFGNAIFGLGYDLDGDGGSFTPTVGPSDPDDHYLDGWLTAGYWSQWVAEATPGNAWGDVDMKISQWGMGDVPLGTGLEHQAWDWENGILLDTYTVAANVVGFSFDPDFSTFDYPPQPGDEPGTPSPANDLILVPEPATAVLLALGLAAAASRRR